MKGKGKKMGNRTTKMNRYRFDSEHHAHILDGKPLIGTTTSISILDKSGLPYWASGMAVTELGWTPINGKDKKKVPREQRVPVASKRFEEIKKLTDDEYLTLLDKAYKAHSVKKDEAKDKGVDMHSLLSKWIDLCICKEGYTADFDLRPISQFADWSEKNVKQFLFTEMNCYSEVCWVGGQADFGYIDMHGDFVLGDFKSSAAPYYSHWLQCGAYDLQISENGGFTADGDKIFESRPIKYHAIFCERNGLDKPFFNRQTDRLKRAFVYFLNGYKEKIWFEDMKCVEGGQ